MSIVRKIFEEHKPLPGEQHVLYTVPAGSTATGTLYIANQSNGDRVWVQMIPAASTLPSSDPRTYLLYSTPHPGRVPIYLQQLYLGQGDSIQVIAQEGNCSFVLTGEEYVN
jgi:outer membrane protein assembly factor BamB